MIEADGIAAKYWPRWRGPSGQGLVARWCVSGSMVGEGERRLAHAGRRGAATRHRSSGAIGSISRRPTTAASDRDRRFPPQRRQAALGNVRAAARHRVRPPEEQPRVGDAGDRRARVYASFGSHGLLAVDLDGKVAWHRPIGRLANYHGSAGSPVLYKDRLFIYQDHGGTTRRLVRRRVRDRDRQAAVADAARRERRLGHAGRDQRQRPRRAGRQQSAPRAGVRSGDRQGALVCRRQYVRSHPDAGRRPRPGVLLLGPRGPDDGDSPRRQRRRHLDARRLVGGEGFAVRAVADARRRRAVSRQRHAEHRHRVRGEERDAAVPGAARRRRGARDSRRRRSR